MVSLHKTASVENVGSGFDRSDQVIFLWKLKRDGSGNPSCEICSRGLVLSVG